MKTIHIMKTIESLEIMKTIERYYENYRKSREKV